MIQLCRHDRTLTQGCRDCLGESDWRVVSDHETVSNRLGDPIRDNDARVTYAPFTDGTVMGFKCTQVGQPDEYIYLNPSTGSDDGAATVFVYIGPDGDPAKDPAVHHYPIGEGWG